MKEHPGMIFSCVFTMLGVLVDLGTLGITTTSHNLPPGLEPLPNLLVTKIIMLDEDTSDRRKTII